MLMDLAFEQVAMQPKRRVHFDAFMLETHARLRRARKREQGDPIEPVAAQIADEARLLCFDEMQVGNPADAMILSRLFGKLIERGGESRDHLQPAAARPLQGWAQPRAVRAVHRADRTSNAGGRGQWPDRLSARSPRRCRGVARAQRPRSDGGACPRHSSSSPIIRSRTAPRCRRRRSTSAAAARSMCPRASRAWRSSRSSACAASRAAPPIISPSRGASTP